MLALFVWRAHSPPAKSQALQSLLADMERFRATNGLYPTSYAGFASFAQVTQQFSVYSGKKDTNGIFWETREVSSHHFTILGDSAGYEVFLPVGHMKMISFSSFPVWRFTSTDHKWEKGRIHWSLVESYWSKD